VEFLRLNKEKNMKSILVQALIVILISSGIFAFIILYSEIARMDNLFEKNYSGLLISVSIIISGALISLSILSKDADKGDSKSKDKGNE
jgi:O-antigen/teichoic acid export membrane protein